MQQLIAYIVYGLLHKLKQPPKSPKKSDKLANIILLTLILSGIGIIVLGVAFIIKKIKQNRAKLNKSTVLTIETETKAINNQHD